VEATAIHSSSSRSTTRHPTAAGGTQVLGGTSGGALEMGDSANVTRGTSAGASAGFGQEGSRPGSSPVVFDVTAGVTGTADISRGTSGRSGTITRGLPSSSGSNAGQLITVRGGSASAPVAAATACVDTGGCNMLRLASTTCQQAITAY
jgi:hypothetical protein